MFYKGAHGAIFVIDLTEKSSLDNLNDWFENVKLNCPDNLVKMIVGNKCDVDEGMEIKKKDINNFIKVTDPSILYLEVSAKTGFNIKDIFKTMARLIIDRFYTDTSKLISPNKSNANMDIQYSKIHDENMSNSMTCSIKLLASKHLNKDCNKENNGERHTKCCSNI